MREKKVLEKQSSRNAHLILILILVSISVEKLQTRHKHMQRIELHTRIEIMAVWQPPDDCASYDASEIFWLLSKKMVCNGRKINTFNIRTHRPKRSQDSKRRAFFVSSFSTYAVSSANTLDSVEFRYIRISLFLYVAFIFRLFFPLHRHHFHSHSPLWIVEFRVNKKKRLLWETQFKMETTEWHFWAR